MDPFWIQVECQLRPSRLRRADQVLSRTPIRPDQVGGIICVRGICSEAACRDLAAPDPSYTGFLKRRHTR